MKAGLEVHQQLATGKLFCNCPSELSETVLGTLTRQLRATGGEERTIDPAVAFEARRGRLFRYEVTTSDCLVEADEEPPHALNPRALEVALTVAALLHARPLDEIEVMRKIVIDGSNTSGFQRTALVAVDGHLEVGGRRYSIPTICLEEDAARKAGEGEGETSYRLDRLGIPLIEIATGPEITDGAEAREVAEEIGAVLRSTRRVRRGIGTIREDLNVSVPGGTRIEIKGVQELRLVEKYAEIESERQQLLITLREKLAQRAPARPTDPVVDVTSRLLPIASGPLRGLREKGSVALALRLPGFDGLLRAPPGGGERLGRELADYARTTGVRGLLHSDELPGYGIDPPLIATLRTELRADAGDAFVIVTAPKRAVAETALERVRERALLAFEGVPPETRDPLPDGRSRYSRPLPGRDRMYPETDVPPVRVEAVDFDRIRAHLPESPAAERARVAAQFGLHAEVVRRLQQEDEIDRLVLLAGRGHAPTTVARLLAQDLEAAAEGLPPGHHEPSDAELAEILGALDAGKFAKEALPVILHRLMESGGPVEAALAGVGLTPLSREELERLANDVIARNDRLVAERGDRARSALMGDLMREVRGRRDGKEVAEVLDAAFRRRQGAASSPA